MTRRKMGAEVRVRFRCGSSGPPYNLLRMHLQQWRKRSCLIVKNKHQPSLGMASAPGVVLCYLHILF